MKYILNFKGNCTDMFQVKGGKVMIFILHTFMIIVTITLLYCNYRVKVITLI